MRRGVLALGLLTGVLLSQVARSSAPPDLRESFRRPSSGVPAPVANQSSPERVELGKMLFFDPRLSGSGQVSCATCHNPGLSWGDGLPRAIGAGHKMLPRRTPTILNVGWGNSMFWDGRADSLEEQALIPIANPEEMNQRMDLMVARVSNVYGPHFSKAYPGEPLTERTVAKALACFERSVVSGPAPFDRWVEGDERAISPAARRGFELFNGKARCATCHTGWRMTDDAFYDIGAKGSDLGRGKLLPGVETVQYAFKTPTLRDVGRRAPYLHDGSEATLADVVELYDVGGRVRRPSLSDEIKPLGLSTQEKTDLVEFLGTLDGENPAVTIPVLPQHEGG